MKNEEALKRRFKIFNKDYELDLTAVLQLLAFGKTPVSLEREQMLKNRGS